MNQRYQEAKTIYKKLGVDVEEALKKLQTFPISMHCWQGDDVVWIRWGRRLYQEVFRQLEIIQEKQEIIRS